MRKLIDDFAKALAQGTSRRQALSRLVTGALAGILPLGISHQLAAAATLDERCAAYCRTVFKTRRKRRRCFKAAQTQTGDCYVRGPGYLQGLCKDWCLFVFSGSPNAAAACAAEAEQGLGPCYATSPVDGTYFGPGYVCTGTDIPYPCAIGSQCCPKYTGTGVCCALTHCTQQNGVDHTCLP